MSYVKRLLSLVNQATYLKSALFNINTLTYSDVRSFYEKMNYPFYTEKGEFNLNIGAIRSSDLTVNVFNDIIFLAWQWKGKGHLHLFKGTTDTGLFYLEHPIHPIGTAIIVPGYYKSVYSLGYHRRNTTFSHLALRQIQDMRYWRPEVYNKDSQLPINNHLIYKEIGYTNLHCYPLKVSLQDFIGKLSAGCIVHQNNQRYFYEFIPIIQEAKKNFGNSFSFALFYEPELLLK